MARGIPKDGKQHPNSLANLNRKAGPGRPKGSKDRTPALRTMLETVVTDKEQAIKDTFGTAVTSVKRILPALELYGRLTGELKPGVGAGTHVEVVVIAGGPQPGKLQAAARRRIQEVGDGQGDE